MSIETFVMNHMQVKRLFMRQMKDRL